MMLYTVASAEEIFAGEKKENRNKKVTMKIDGGLVEGVRGEGGLRIERLITTDLKMYLDKRFEVGKILK